MMVKMDQVHTLRDQYNADLVILITEASMDYCGIAWVLQNEQLYYDYIGFSVVSYFCMGTGKLYRMRMRPGTIWGLPTTAIPVVLRGCMTMRGATRSSSFYTIMAYSNGTHNALIIGQTRRFPTMGAHRSGLPGCQFGR